MSSTCRFVPGHSNGAREAPAVWVCPGDVLASSRSGLLGVASRPEEALEQARRSVPVRGQGAFAGVGPARGARGRPGRLADDPAGLQFKAPGMPKAQDAFRSEEDHWFTTEKKFYRVVRSQPPALIAFSYVDRPELVEDFLKPPGSRDQGRRAVSYRGSIAATSRVFDWALDGSARQVDHLAGERPDGHADGDHRVSDQQRAGSIRSWATTRSRSPCSRFKPARASRSPTWRWRTCRWSPT